MNCYGITDVGKKRTTNQDCFSVHIPENSPFSCILTVCDGMGGANGGEIASQTAIDIYCKTLVKELCGCDGEGAVKSAMAQAVNLANLEVYRKASENTELSGMGTTLISALIPMDKEQIYLANLGDSRAYLVSEKELLQISHDHSYVQHLVDIGELSPSKAANHPDRNIIMRAVGIDSEVLPDIKSFSTAGYSYLLLCSDGLHGMVKANDIKKIIMSEDTDIREKAEALVTLANKKGGNDNITVILASLDRCETKE